MCRAMVTSLFVVVGLGMYAANSSGPAHGAEAKISTGAEAAGHAAATVSNTVWRPSSDTDTVLSSSAGCGTAKSESVFQTVAMPIGSTVVYSPVPTVATPASVPVTTYSPVTVSAPVTTYSPVAVSAPVTTYSPVTVTAPVTTYSPVTVATPVTTYAPVTAYSPVTVTAPVTTYSPVATVTAYSPVTAVVPAPVAVGPAVLVRPKVYVAGQPVRNFFRAITP